MPEKTEDDLILGDEAVAEMEDIIEEEYDLHDEIASAYNALCAISEMDEQILSKEKARMIRAIRRKSLEILHYNISEIHKDIFGTKEDGED